MHSELMRSSSAGTQSISTTPRQYARPLEVRSICRSLSGTDLADTVALARMGGLQVLGADANGPSTVDHPARSGELTRPTLWVMGNRLYCRPSAALLDRLVALPMYGRGREPQPLDRGRGVPVRLQPPNTAPICDCSGNSAENLLFPDARNLNLMAGLWTSFLNCPSAPCVTVHPEGAMSGPTPATTPFRSRR